MPIAIKKCEFYIIKTKFYRFIIKLGKLSRDLKKINSVLKKHLDEFIIAYLDNIIIYSNSKKEHFQYIKWVLQRLSKENMLVAIKKYKFYIIKTEFYKFIIKLEIGRAHV